MFKTIFSKMVFFYVAILIFSFALTSIVLYAFLTNFVVEDKVKELRENLNKASNALDALQDNKINQNTENYVIKILSSIDKNSLLWVIDKNGKCEYILNGNIDNNIISKIISKLERTPDGSLQLTDQRQYQKLVNGTEDFLVNTSGDFYGLFKDTGISWLTVAKPYIFEGEIRGAIFIHIPFRQIDKARSVMFSFFLNSVIISVGISILIIYLFSARMVKPIKEMKNAASIIAGGQFNKRIEIDSNDEIGELAKSFNHMVTALEKLEIMRRNFIANVSHELRTPMTSIKGFVEGILDGTIPKEKQNQYLEIVRDETLRLNRLVSNLLDLARIESGGLKLSFSEFNINELLRKCIIKLENQILQKKLEIEAVFEEDQLLVYADIDAIERVIINLLHNAIKFTPECRKILITTSSDKNIVIVSIEDEGIGISNEEINMIWERFYKSDKSRSQDKTGTGLGLSIVKNIINEHGNKIWVESEIGKGTKFFFTLKKITK